MRNGLFKKLISLSLSCLLIFTMQVQVLGQIYRGDFTPQLAQRDATARNIDVSIRAYMQERIEVSLTLDEFLDKANEALTAQNYDRFFELVDEAQELAYKNFLDNSSYNFHNAVASVGILNSNLLAGLVPEELRLKIQTKLENYFSDIKRCRGDICALDAERAMLLTLTEERFQKKIADFNINIEAPISIIAPDARRHLQIFSKAVKNNYGTLEEDVTIKLGLMDAAALAGGANAIQEMADNILGGINLSCKLKYDCPNYSLAVATVNRLGSYKDNAVDQLIKIANNDRNRYTIAANLQANLVLGAYFDKNIKNKTLIQNNLEDFYCKKLDDIKNPDLHFEMANQVAGVYFRLGGNLPFARQEFTQDGKVVTKFYKLNTQTNDEEYYGTCAVHYRNILHQGKVQQSRAENEIKHFVGFQLFAWSFINPTVLFITMGYELQDQVRTAIKDRRTFKEVGPNILLTTAFMGLPVVGKVAKYTSLLEKGFVSVKNAKRIRIASRNLQASINKANSAIKGTELATKELENVAQKAQKLNKIIAKEEIAIKNASGTAVLHQPKELDKIKDIIHLNSLDPVARPVVAERLSTAKPAKVGTSDDYFVRGLVARKMEKEGVLYSRFIDDAADLDAISSALSRSEKKEFLNILKQTFKTKQKDIKSYSLKKWIMEGNVSPQVKNVPVIKQLEYNRELWAKNLLGYVQGSNIPSKGNIIKQLQVNYYKNMGRFNRNYFQRRTYPLPTSEILSNAQTKTIFAQGLNATWDINNVGGYVRVGNYGRGITESQIISGLSKMGQGNKVLVLDMHGARAGKVLMSQGQMFGMEDIALMLQSIRATGEHITIIAENCFSGALVKPFRKLSAKLREGLDLVTFTGEGHITYGNRLMDLQLTYPQNVVLSKIKYGGNIGVRVTRSTGETIYPLKYIIKDMENLQKSGVKKLWGRPVKEILKETRGAKNFIDLETIMHDDYKYLGKQLINRQGGYLTEKNAIDFVEKFPLEINTPEDLQTLSAVTTYNIPINDKGFKNFLVVPDLLVDDVIGKTSEIFNIPKNVFFDEALRSFRRTEIDFGTKVRDSFQFLSFKKGNFDYMPRKIPSVLEDKVHYAKNYEELEKHIYRYIKDLRRDYLLDMEQYTRFTGKRPPFDDKYSPYIKQALKLQ